MNTKKCSKCKETKELEDFSFKSVKDGSKLPHCKSCQNLYYQSKKEELKKQNRDNYHSKMKDESFRELRKIQHKNYYNDNKDKISDHRSSPEERKKTNEYYKNKRKNDVNFLIRSNTSSRIRTALKRNKFTSSEYLLGCSVQELRDYMESLWLDGMSWDNYGNPNGDHTDCWHMDHIIPCNSFDLTRIDQQIICFHYTNMQPLWAIDNLRKGDTI